MTTGDIHLPQRRSFGQTSRTDAWWLQPLVVFLGLGAFIVYTTWAAFQGVNYFYAQGTGAYTAHYLSPFYSPLLYGQPGEPYWIGLSPPGWWPGWFPFAFSPAFLILAGPALMRFTCYYYRGAYYKAFWMDPAVVRGGRAARPERVPRREASSRSSCRTSIATSST